MIAFEDGKDVLNIIFKKFNKVLFQNLLNIVSNNI